MRPLFIAALLLAAVILAPAHLASQGAADAYPFRDPNLPDDARITDLISRMTLEEKIECMGMRASVPRLGVVGSPHIEGYHGVAQGGPSNWGQRNPTPTTQFPQAYGLGATWDPALIQRVAAQEAQEARYLFQSAAYNRSGLIVRAPNADLARDPRWGRTEEVYGEDPFHVGALAAAFTRGLQGDDPRYWKTAALLKHFLANSNEDTRNFSSSNFDDRLWREYYAWPFERAVRDGGSRALMAAYNAVNGTPAHVHPMWRDIVMREWGVDGIICTDGGGLRLLVTDHKAFPDLPAAAAACVKAGINHFLDRQQEPLAEAVKRGLLAESDLDAALRGLFRVSLKLGLLDPAESVPYSRIGAPGDPEPWAKPETRALRPRGHAQVDRAAQEQRRPAAAGPREDQVGAVVGPLANTVLLDWYSGTPPYAVSPRRASSAWPRRRRAGARAVGVSWVGDMGDAAIAAAAHPRRRGRVRGQPSRGQRRMGDRHVAERGQGGRRPQGHHPPAGQEEFIRRLYEANPNTIVVLVANFPFAMPWAAANASTILQHDAREPGAWDPRWPTCCSATPTPAASSRRRGRARSTSSPR